VLKIGIRAIISIGGKPMLSTHWDEHPASLGRDLLNCDKSVITEPPQFSRICIPPTALSKPVLY
jgi:hypothetical protein